MLVSAHQAGAVIAALWCHARRGARSADALILADPDFGPDLHWLYRLLGVRQPAPAAAGRPGAEPRPGRTCCCRGRSASCGAAWTSPARCW